MLLDIIKTIKCEILSTSINGDDLKILSFELGDKNEF